MLNIEVKQNIGFNMKMLKNIFSVVLIKTNLEINFSLPRMFFCNNYALANDRQLNYFQPFRELGVSSFVSCFQQRLVKKILISEFKTTFAAQQSHTGHGAASVSLLDLVFAQHLSDRRSGKIKTKHIFKKLFKFFTVIHHS